MRAQIELLKVRSCVGYHAFISSSKSALFVGTSDSQTAKNDFEVTRLENTRHFCFVSVMALSVHYDCSLDYVPRGNNF